MLEALVIAAAIIGAAVIIDSTIVRCSNNLLEQLSLLEARHAARTKEKDR